MTIPGFFAEIMTRIKYFFLPNPRQAVDEELAFHLEQLTHSYLAAGMSAEEAHRRAMIDLGGVQAAREQAREQRPAFPFEILLQDIRFSLKTFQRQRVFTLTIVATLMLGFGATTAVFSVVDRILFRGLPYGRAGQLVSLGLDAPIEPDEFMLGSSYFQWQDHQTPFSAMTSETGVDPCDLTEERPVRLNCGHVQGNFLTTLEVSPVAGRNFSAAEDTPGGPGAVLISDSLWRNRFNRNAAAVGKLLHLDGRSYEIVGVLPADFEMPRLQKVDVLLPQALDVAVQRGALPGRLMWAFARLKPSVTLAQARLQLQPLFEYSLAGAPPRFRQELHLRVRTLRDRQMQHTRTAAWLLFGLVIAVLLIACANVASLMLARATQRMREQAVRAALGASCFRLVRQAVTESILLGMAGAVAGVALAFLLLRVFRTVGPEGLPFLGQSAIDTRVLIFTGAVGLVSALVFGAIPALRQPQLTLLAGRTVGMKGEARLRRWLVIGQLAASLFLLVGSVLLSRSFDRLQSQNLGFQARSLLSLTIFLGDNAYPTSASRQAFFATLRHRLDNGPGITGSAVTDTLPPGGEHHDQIFASILAAGHPPPVSGTGGMVIWRSVTPEYFKLMSIPLLNGQGFTSEEAESPDHVVVLSEILAKRLFANEDPIGRQIHVAVGAPDLQNPAYTVVGVVADVKNGGLAASDEPEYYRLRRMRPEDWDAAAMIILRTDLPMKTIDPWIRAQVAAVDPTVPVKIATLSQAVAEQADQQRFEALLVSLFAIIGLLLAAVGLYGVIVFLVAQRTQEVGLRMALGATRTSIFVLFLRGSLHMIVPGVGLGLLLSLSLSSLMASLLYDISPRDPGTLLGAAAILTLIAVLATMVPARAAVNVDPNIALRNE